MGGGDDKVCGDVVHGGSGIGNLGSKICENGGTYSGAGVGRVRGIGGWRLHEHGTFVEMEFIFRLSDFLEGIARESVIENGKREDSDVRFTSGEFYCARDDVLEVA